MKIFIIILGLWIFLGTMIWVKLDMNGDLLCLSTKTMFVMSIICGPVVFAGMLITTLWQEVIHIWFLSLIKYLEGRK